MSGEAAGALFFLALIVWGVYNFARTWDKELAKQAKQKELVARTKRQAELSRSEREADAYMEIEAHGRQPVWHPDGYWT